MATGRYESPLRDARAEDTRRRIREAARLLFEEAGFASTTIARVAAAAGVAPATVYATFGSKAGIVVAMLEDVEDAAGMGERVPEMLAEQDPYRCVALFAAGNRAVFELGHTILRAAMDARGIAEVGALAAAGDANRRRGCDELVRRWDEAGAIRPGLGPTTAAETMWLLSGVEQYLLATEQLGWSADIYEAWLTDLLQRELLAPRS